MVRLTRADAGRRLALAVGSIMKETPTIVALSPGGVRVGHEIARALRAPLDVRACVPLEVPGRLHSMFGAVADGTVILVPERQRSLGLPEGYVEVLVEIARRKAHRIAAGLRGGIPALDLAGRPVILVDDGASCAITVTAAAHALRAAGARLLIYLAPVATPELWAALAEYCDERLLLYPVASRVSTLIMDPEFEQTTALDVGRMIRQSRQQRVEAGASV